MASAPTQGLGDLLPRRRFGRLRDDTVPSITILEPEAPVIVKEAERGPSRTTPVGSAEAVSARGGSTDGPTPLGTPVIATAALTKRYPGSDEPAVDEFSFAVNEGEIMAIVGQSGCGKTTTLRLLAGFEAPDSGEVRIRDRVVASATEWVPPEQRGLGMVFQQFALFPHLTAIDNVTYGLKGMSSAERRQRAEHLLALLRIGDLGKRYPHQLSGGQQQRVALARALAPQPLVLLMDEPFGSLDADLRSQLRREVKDILKHLGATAILVTHDHDEAFLMADRVVVLHQGRLQQLNTPDNVYHRPINRIVARFAGLADFLPASIEDRQVMTEIGAFPLRGEAPGETVDLLVRPDDIRLSPSDEGEGVIVGREFKGADNLYTVRLPSGRIVRAIEPSDPVYGDGARVQVSATLRHVVLFRRHPERPPPT